MENEIVISGYLGTSDEKIPIENIHTLKKTLLHQYTIKQSSNAGSLPKMGEVGSLWFMIGLILIIILILLNRKQIKN